MGLCAELPNHIPACRFEFNLAKSGLHVDDEFFSFEIEGVMPFYFIANFTKFQNLQSLKISRFY